MVSGLLRLCITLWLDGWNLEKVVTVVHLGVKSANIFRCIRASFQSSRIQSPLRSYDEAD